MSTALTVASIENKKAGDEVSVAISIDTDSGNAISALTLVFNFDPSQLEPLSPAASAGSLTQAWGSPVANATQGQIRISQSSATPLSSNNGEILILNFKIKEGAANTIALGLDGTSSSIMEGQINFTSNDGVIRLSSTDPVNSPPTGTLLINGTPTQGETLTADTSAIADEDGLGTFSYQWQADGVDIIGANQSTFALTQNQVGKAISVTASYTDDQGTEESLTSAATIAVANTNDSPTDTRLTVASIENKKAGDEVSVAISIDTDSGNVISALDLVFKFDPNELEPLSPAASAGALTQSWGSPVANATQGQIQISQFSASPLSENNGEILVLNFKIKEDVTSKIDLNLDETSSEINEGQIIFSSTDGVISLSSTDSVNPRPTATLVINGTPTQGETLTADISGIDEDDVSTFSYQWKADDDDIVGATQDTFALTQDQVGKTITVTASYTDGQGTAESLSSAATTAVTNVNDVPTGNVVITGTAAQGETLTADTSAIADADGLGDFSYQWQADDDDIVGATQDTFALTQDQVGKTITVTASYTDGQGTPESLTSALTIAVANTNDSPTGNVTINGDPAQGQTLNADTSAIADPDGLGTFSYQWQADGVDINGANQSTFVLTQDQVGQEITVTASYTDGQGTPESLTSAATIAVANTNDSPTGNVTINGNPAQGQTLTADTSAIADPDGLGTFSYQWTADGVDINGANQSTFALTQAQVGRIISVTASYTDGWGTNESLTSAATSPVANINDAPTGNVTINGDPAQGQTLTADTSAIADPDGLGTFSYQWQADSVDINGANQSTFALTQDQVGKAISVTASYTDGQGTPESLTSSTTTQIVGSQTPIKPTISVTISTEPTSTNQNGEVDTLPSSNATLSEWEEFYAEIWLNSNDSSESISAGTLNLNYNTQITSARDVEFNPLFNQFNSYEIDDMAGSIKNIGGGTFTQSVGQDKHLLFARIKFAPLGEDQVAINKNDPTSSAIPLSLEVSNSLIAIAGAGNKDPLIGETPSSSLVAVPYDYDDNNSIDFGDFSFFAPVFGKEVNEILTPDSTWADFDSSGTVDFGDFSYFAPNFGKSRISNDIIFPPQS